MTVLEVPCERKPYKIMDRSREIKKGVMAETLVELIERGESFLSYSKYGGEFFSLSIINIG